MDAAFKLKAMFLLIIVIEIPLGLFMLLAPQLFISLLGFPTPQDPIIYGVAASVWLAFGVLSILGVREPMKFVPVLLFQFTYKTIWFLAVILPLAISGTIQMYGLLMIAVFAVFVAGDIIVIPWKTYFKKSK